MTNRTPQKPEIVIAAVPQDAEEFVAIAAQLWHKLKGVQPTAKKWAVFQAVAEQQFGPAVSNQITQH